MKLDMPLVRNSSWLFVARVGAQICAVVVTYLLTRRLSLAEFGEYSFIAAAILIGNTLTTFGSDMYLIREIASKDDYSLLSPALTLQLVFSTAFIFLVFVFSPHLPNQTSESIFALRVYSFALIPLAFYAVFTSAFRGAQKMDSYALLNLLVSILQVAAIYWFLESGSGIVTLAYLLLGVQLMATAAAGLFCAATIPRFLTGWQFSGNKIRGLLIACLPIALIAVLGILYQRLSLTMLSLFGSASIAGLFSASLRVVEATRMGHFAVLTAMYPAMANSNEKKDSSESFGRTFMLLLAMAVVINAILFAFAKSIIAVFFGVEFQMSVASLRILSLAISPYTVNSFLSLRYLVDKREKDLMRILSMSLTLLFLMNIWLIPRFGLIGASWASVSAEVIQAAIMFSFWRLKTNSLQKGRSHELSNPSR